MPVELIAIALLTVLCMMALAALSEPETLEQRARREQGKKAC